jgi:dTDP-4-amino-4,6-dideoxygalactose transaminase
VTTGLPREEPFLVFGAPLIGDAEVEQVVGCLRSGWIGTGPLVRRFEAAFAAYRGVEHVAAVNSCTAALHLSLLAADLQPGDEVITTAMTFCATVNAIIHAGATPVLADCDPRSLCLDPEDVRRRLTPRTRALVPVHFAGQACDMDALGDIARTHGLRIIEDCAHAIETTYRGKPVGSFGDFGCFSFYVTKNVTTGEGGMIVARRAEDADRVRVLALHGMSKDAWKRFSDAGYKHYAVVAAGFKYNMMDLQAAIGLHQLEQVERNWARRQEVWARYQEAFADLPLQRPAAAPAHVRHGYHLYTVLVDRDRCGLTRDEFLDAMTARRIGVGVHYQSIPTHPYYRERYGWDPADYPVSRAVGASTVSLPLSPKLTDGDVDRVIHAVRDILDRAHQD